MTVRTEAGLRAYRWVATACVLALLVTGGLWFVFRDPGGTTLSAVFEKTRGLYGGSAVRVLGVEVGEVTKIAPQGRTVRVSMRVDSGVRIPADAGAVIVAPSLVSDRYLQLTPAYSGGPVMASGTVLPRSRTATPLEIDDLYGSLDKLATDLGPRGANREGALSDLLDTTARNFSGNGKNLNETITELSGLTETLDNSKGDLFATVRDVQTFTTALADSDKQVNEFYQRLADVTGFLASDADDVGTALSSLSTALDEVQRFVRQNKEGLTSNVDKLAGLTRILVGQRAALAETLDTTPTGLTNYINSYDGATGSIAFRYNANELTNPLFTSLCRVLKGVNFERLPDMVGNLCDVLEPVVDGVAKLPSVPELLGAISSGKLPPLPLTPLVSIPEEGR